MSPTTPRKREAYAGIALAVLTVVACAALMMGVAIAHAPTAVVPLAVAVCIGCPLAMAWPVPRMLSALRAARTATKREHDEALAALRRHLATLPEREHPLGL